MLYLLAPRQSQDVLVQLVPVIVLVTLGLEGHLLIRAPTSVSNRFPSMGSATNDLPTVAEAL
jgi:hypothetical protein